MAKYCVRRQLDERSNLNRFYRGRLVIVMTSNDKQQVQQCIDNYKKQDQEIFITVTETRSNEIVYDSERGWIEK